MEPSPLVIGCASPFDVESTLGLWADPPWELGIALGGLRAEMGTDVQLLGRRGRVVEVRRHHGRCSLRLSWDDDPGGPATEVALNPRPGSRCRVRVREQVAGEEVGARRAAWQRGLDELARQLGAADRRRRSYRQAVIVVHGIGEQRVGETMRGFVDAVLHRDDLDAPVRRFSRPDPLAHVLGAQMTSIPGDWSQDRPTTDVFELSWAHLVRETPAAQVYAWVVRLLLAPDRRVTRRLRPHVWVARLALVAALAYAAWRLVRPEDSSAAASSVAAVTLLAPLALWLAQFLRGVLGKVVVGNVLGDAARYFDPGPANVEARQSIREAGRALFDRVHDSDRYDRVVVYGHSLGSVIAYDVLTDAWARRAREWRVTEPRRTARLRAVEAAVNARPDGRAPIALRPREAARLQHAAWHELNANGFTWKVSDLVTSGSPLTHARWLLDPPGSRTFEDLLADRVLPACPPRTSEERGPVPGVPRRRFTFTRSGTATDGSHATALVPDPTAPFAVTRWTNLYFPHRGVLRGDPVGGPVAPVLGAWVHDRPLTPPPGLLLGFAHTAYHATAPGRWGRNRSAAPPLPHLRGLREAVGLSVRQQAAQWHAVPR